MLESLLDERIETIETIARRLDALPAANGEPDASYWRAVRAAARVLLDVAESKIGEHEDSDT